MASPLPADFCAVVTLDESGRITTANTAAHQLWLQADLLGQAFAGLFVFEVVSNDPEFVAAQWDVLLASSLDRDVVLSVEPVEGTSRDVRVRLEKPAGLGGYIATLRPARTAPTPAVGGSDATLQLLAEQSALGFFELNFSTGSVQFSPTWKRLLGYAPSELADTLATWDTLIHPDDSAAAPTQLGRKVAPGPRRFSVDFRMRHQRGQWIWIQCTGVQIVAPDGTLERVAGVHVDITERKELEDALVANDARLHDLSGAGPLGAFELDFAHGVFWFSAAFEKLLGYGEGELPPSLESFAAVLPPEDAPEGADTWLLARSPGLPSFAEVVNLRSRDGQPVPVLLGAVRSVNRRRELTRVVGFASALPTGATLDRTRVPPLHAETALATLAEGVLIADTRGKIIFANTAAVRLLRTDGATVRSQPVADVFRLVDRQSGRPGTDPVDRALTTDQPLPLLSSDALALDGPAPLPIVWTARAVYEPNGAPQGVVIVFRDPEEMTLTPEELVRANRFESLGLLAGGISHDFNNLLTTILGAVSVAKENHDYSALSDAEKACDAAKGLTRQLLAFAKGGGGTQTVCDAKEIVADSIKIAAAGSDADFTVRVADDTPPVRVDRGQILQVFQNLIINALQAMPPPPHRAKLQLRAQGIAVAENQVPGLAPGDYVEFEVRDNGSGIKPEHVEKIFDPFFTTKKHGTGLGLATVLSIVRKHGGQIALDTQVGVGTAFTVYLPKADKPVETQARRAASLRFGTGRVLLMDDDPNISSLTARMLESLDYKYDLAKNGEEAITLYKRYLNIGRPYDAVIMDLTVVGGMGGEECFGELRKLDADVRAIVSSGYDNDEMARKFLDQGFCGYLTKPYRVTDLGKVLKAVLG